MKFTRRLALAAMSGVLSRGRSNAGSLTMKEATMLAKTKLGAISYYVKDLDRTERFWRDTLGFAADRIPDGDGPGFMMLKTANGIDLVFFEQEPKPGNSPIVVFELEEGGIDGVVAGLAKAGVTIVTPVSHAPGGWTADFADPDGHAISLYQSGEKSRKMK
jgi:predicted enzyme related to lactoylglutathione lyase